MKQTQSAGGPRLRWPFPPLPSPLLVLAAALGAPERDAEQPSAPCAPQLSVPAPAEGSGGNGGARAAQTVNGA